MQVFTNNVSDDANRRAMNKSSLLFTPESISNFNFERKHTQQKYYRRNDEI